MPRQARPAICAAVARNHRVGLKIIVTRRAADGGSAPEADSLRFEGCSHIGCLGTSLAEECATPRSKALQNSSLENPPKTRSTQLYQLAKELAPPGVQHRTVRSR
jgi:hypothetical protein